MAPGLWERLFRELARRGRSADTQMIDPTHVKTQRLIRRVKPSKRMLRDQAYDSAELREELNERELWAKVGDGMKG